MVIKFNDLSIWLKITYVMVWIIIILSLIGWIFIIEDNEVLKSENEYALNEHKCMWEICIGDETYHYSELSKTCHCYLQSIQTHKEYLG